MSILQEIRNARERITLRQFIEEVGNETSRRWVWWVLFILFVCAKL